MADGGTDKQLLQVHLAEFQMIFNQMHTRMQGNFQLISTGVLLFTVTISLLLLYWDILLNKQLYAVMLIVPVPFYFLLLIQLREDLLMFSHDRYFNLLRVKILTSVGATDSDGALHFLKEMEYWKAGRPYFKLLSASRYSFSLFSISASLFLYLYFVVEYKVQLNLLNILLLVLNLILLPITIRSFFGVQRIFLRGRDD